MKADFVPHTSEPEKSHALFLAVRCGDLGEVRRLLATGAEAGMNRDETWRAIMHNPDFKCSSVLALLRGQPPGKILNAPLYAAALYGRGDIIKELMSQTPYCLQSLELALRGAALARSEAGVSMVLEALGGDAKAVNARAVIFDCADHADAGIVSGIIEKTGDYSSGLQFMVRKGFFQEALGLFDNADDLLPAVREVCRALEDSRTDAGETRNIPYLSLLDKILEREKGRLGVRRVLPHIFQAALDYRASVVVEHVLDHPDFKSCAGYKNALDAALRAVVNSSAPLFDGLYAYGGHRRLAKKILDMGGDPQEGLAAAVRLPNLYMVRETLARAADPRLEGGSLLRLARTAAQKPSADPDVVEIYTLLKSEADSCSAKEWADFCAAVSLEAENAGWILQTDQKTGKKGIVIAAQAAQIKPCLEVLKKDGRVLKKEDVLGEEGGVSLLSVLTDREETSLLIDAALWGLHENDFEEVFQGVADTPRTGCAEALAELVLARAADRRIEKVRKNIARKGRGYRL